MQHKHMAWQIKKKICGRRWVNHCGHSDFKSTRYFYKSLPSWVGMYCKAWQGSVCYQIFSQTRPNFSISFCRHLEHCKIRIKFALRHYWITHIEMWRFFNFRTSWNMLMERYMASWPGKCILLKRHDAWWTNDAIPNDVGFSSLA
jgi:hypothetical protein